jgi:hypothetical protein
MPYTDIEVNMCDRCLKLIQAGNELVAQRDFIRDLAYNAEKIHRLLLTPWRRWCSGFSALDLDNMLASNAVHRTEAYKVLSDLEFQYDLLKDGKAAAEVNRAVKQTTQAIVEDLHRAVKDKTETIQGLAKALDESLPYNTPDTGKDSTWSATIPPST